MSSWIDNLKRRLERYPVVILHGNVRDWYIDRSGTIYENLTQLLRQVVREMYSMNFLEIIFYDPVTRERREPLRQVAFQDEQQSVPSGDEFASTAPTSSSEQSPVLVPPTRVLARWACELAETGSSRFAVLYYLDQLVAYRQGGYSADEKEVILRLEKVIENITPNNRLVMVCLQDTMIPVELYTASPKTSLLAIPMPSKADRRNYLSRRLTSNHLELITDLTDGLFLRDLENIVEEISRHGEENAHEVRRLVNKYRLGEPEDYWSQLSIEKIDHVDDTLRNEDGIKGQDEALLKVKHVLVRARAGLAGVASGASSRPRGVLFFAGPTGVGKTLVAKKLAKFLFGTEEAFIRLDMSEFKEEHAVAKFIGSPPGYVGYEQGGILTNAVRERPFSVILFDEIEKAHPRIMDIFLQILDEGRLTDSRGQTVFFTETIIIFTSNIGTRTTDSGGQPIDELQKFEEIITNDALSHEEKRQQVQEHFVSAVRRFFTREISRPELYNRIGDNNVVPFNPIHTADIQIDIVRSHLRRIGEEVKDRHRAVGYTVCFDDNIAKWLVEKHGKSMSSFGGRGITNAIEDEVIQPLAYAILRAEFQQLRGRTFNLKVQDNQIVVKDE